MAAASASGAFSAWATLPWACDTSADAEVHAQQLRQQIARLLLRQVVARAQHAHKRQRTRADLPTGHAGGQRCAVWLAAARASTAVQTVLINPRLDRRHIEDLVAQRLAVGMYRGAALAHRRRWALDDAVDLGFVERGPEAALVARLRTAFAPAGSTLGTVAAGRAVGRRRLGRIARLQLQPLLQQRHLLEKLGNLQRLRLDHFMALPQRCRHGRRRSRHSHRTPLVFLNVAMHSPSV